MKILVANLGSTSFKYRLFDMADERQLARGGIERIGEAESPCFTEIDGRRVERRLSVPDHAVAVRECLAQLTDVENGCLRDASEVAAIGFKAVHGGRVSGVQRVTEDVLEAMTEMNDLAPAHNPPYIAAMRLLRERLPEIPLIAAFETGFHQTIEPRNRFYAIPYEWSVDHLVQRWGFHGASHRYIATRAAELLQRDDLRIVSCHLGGSSSLCAIRHGKSVATSMGMSPQSGLPQNNRVGDFDPFAIPHILRKTGKTLEELLHTLACESGLAGLGGAGNDLRDIVAAAERGEPRARLAMEVYVADIRRYLGAMLVELGGFDAIVFTGGIGENRAALRADVLRNLEAFGIVLDAEANAMAKGEAKVHAAASRAEIWTIPTNEELIVARQAAELLSGDGR